MIVFVGQTQYVIADLLVVTYLLNARWVLEDHEYVIHIGMCIWYHGLALEQVGEILRVGAQSANPDRIYVRFMNTSNTFFHNITDLMEAPLVFYIRIRSNFDKID